VESLKVKANGRGYTIDFVDNYTSIGEFVGAAGYKKCAIITDENVDKLYADEIMSILQAYQPFKMVFPAGEATKNPQNLIAGVRWLANNNFSRTDLVIALGGGVVGDLAGFIAATYDRGVDFIQVPTTIVAQCDSSIGGKVAVDIPEGKNRFGAFYPPKYVCINASVLQTLPERNRADGMAEVIKHGCIYDAKLFDDLSRGIDDFGAIVRRNCQIKQHFVEADEYDRGLRMQLNFGHTLAHSIESYYGNDGEKFTHGEAVAVGMAVMARIGERLGVTEGGTYEKIVDVLKKYRLPYKTDVPIAELIGYMKGDKKVMGGVINVIMLEKIGSAFVRQLKIDEVGEFYDNYSA
jgi:3-dehydroquinate synthase